MSVFFFCWEKLQILHAAFCMLRSVNILRVFLDCREWLCLIHVLKFTQLHELFAVIITVNKSNPKLLTKHTFSVMAFPPHRIQFKLSNGNTTIAYLVQEMLPPIYKTLSWQYNHNIWCTWNTITSFQRTESWQYNHYICVWGNVTT